MKKNIRELNLEELTRLIEQEGEKRFRAKQIYEWIWKLGIVDFDKMTNLPVVLRNYLKNNFIFNSLKIESIQKSNDETIKCLFKLNDELFIESVIIPANDRITICISSQVGCKLKCKFCATGTIGFKRNLESGEIYDQVKILNDISEKKFHKRISNIVLMGMGEPLYNYNNVNKAILHITDQHGLGFSPKRITLSTIGIPVMIRKMADDNVKYGLAVSVHSAIQEKRLKIMPVARNHTLDLLLDSLQYYTKKTGQKVTFEYVLLKGINDSLEDAKAMVKYGSHLASKVNLIEYNPIEGFGFLKSNPEDVKKFMDFLRNKGMNVYLRKSRGNDIDAACGQLANKSFKNVQ